MNIRDTRIHQALALLLRILLLHNSPDPTIAVVLPEQYSNYLPQSYYSQSLSGYGNENQNYFNNPDAPGPANGYSSEAYQRQQFPPTSYGDSGGGLNEADTQQSYDQQQMRNSFHPQSDYQEYLDGNFSPFRKEQDFALDSYGHHYGTRQSASAGPGTSTAVSFDDTHFKNTDTVNHQPNDDILYPPLDTGTRQQSQYLRSVDYITNTSALHPIPDNINSLPTMAYFHNNPATTTKDNIAAANAGAHITLTVDRPSTLPRDAHASLNTHNHHHPHHLHHNHHQFQRSPKPYFESDTQPHQHQHHQDQHQPIHQSESHENNKLLSHSPSRTYYVTDNDPVTSSSNYSPDTQPLTVHPNHFIQQPPLPAAASPPVTFPLPGEPIPISKHVEITKHVPIPIYRQIHVPIRKPIRIEIPRPVISTIPRPYPIQVPTISKTVAVPLMREVKIPIEKVTPYPVEHRVPYVVEKRVPFQVEKQIPAPVFYPFPVKVPMVRTVVHKKKTHLQPTFHYHPKIHM